MDQGRFIVLTMVLVWKSVSPFFASEYTNNPAKWRIESWTFKKVVICQMSFYRIKLWISWFKTIEWSFLLLQIVNSTERFSWNLSCVFNENNAMLASKLALFFTLLTMSSGKENTEESDPFPGEWNLIFIWSPNRITGITQGLQGAYKVVYTVLVAPSRPKKELVTDRPTIGRTDGHTLI